VFAILVFTLTYMQLLDLIDGLQSSSVDWTVIGNPFSKLDFGFGLPIQFFHFNPNPKNPNF